MQINSPLSLLGGISPAEFMTRYWQKKPLLVRQAISPQALSHLPSRDQLLAMANQMGVSSRLIRQTKPQTQPNQTEVGAENAWQLTHNPTKLPSLKSRAWTLLVQGVNLHDAATHQLLEQFRFVPDSRLDDAMFSFATTEGGVGPHFDSYDVFLLQTSGRKRWSISAQKDLTLIEDVPLKILAHFKPSKTYVLEPGDMLYLPPRYAHDGVALAQEDGSHSADCITCSIGFRAPNQQELARELMDRLLEDLDEQLDSSRLYSDPNQCATHAPAQIPPALQTFAYDALQAVLHTSNLWQIHLGEYLTEPKANVCFAASPHPVLWENITNIRLHPATRMMFDAHHIFINGESFCATGQDARLMRKLANKHQLSSHDLAKASHSAQELLTDWLAVGWCV